MIKKLFFLIEEKTLKLQFNCSNTAAHGMPSGDSPCSNNKVEQALV